MAQRVEEGALLAGEQASISMKPVTGSKIVDEVDAARDRGQPKLDGDEQDEQQAPPEDRHRIAGERSAHQRLVDRCRRA